MIIHCKRCSNAVTVEVRIIEFSLTERGFEPGGTYATPPYPWAQDPRTGEWDCMQCARITEIPQ